MKLFRKIDFFLNDGFPKKLFLRWPDFMSNHIPNQNTKLGLPTTLGPPGLLDLVPCAFGTKRLILGVRIPNLDTTAATCLILCSDDAGKRRVRSGFCLKWALICLSAHLLVCSFACLLISFALRYRPASRSCTHSSLNKIFNPCLFSVFFCFQILLNLH